MAVFGAIAARLLSLLLALSVGVSVAVSADANGEEGFSPSDAYGLLEDVDAYYDPSASQRQPEPRRQVVKQKQLHLVPAARITIYPGDVISDDMLFDLELSASEMRRRPVFARRSDLVGMVSRQTLLPERPIPAAAVRAPYAVKQGQPVRAVFSVSGLLISTTAVPLQDGSIGDVVSLRNQESGTTIRGVVQKDGTVRVGMQ